MHRDLEAEQEILKRRQTAILTNLQKDFENEKLLRKEKFAMQISKYMQSGESLDENDQNEEKREIAVSYKKRKSLENNNKILFFRYILNTLRKNMPINWTKEKKNCSTNMKK